MGTEPFISVIIPTFNRPAGLLNCLEGFAIQHYPQDRFEVIVVDDGGSTSLDEVFARVRPLINLTPMSQRHAGPAAARNRGAAHARGEFLAFTDDDCVPAAGWLRILAGRLAESPERAVGGRTVNVLVRNTYANASQAIVDIVYARYNADHGSARFFCSNNIVLPATQFARMGGFDSTFDMAGAEDRDLCDRWLQQGYQMTFAPEAIVYHEHPLTLRKFWRQHFNYGRGAFRFYRARSARGSGTFRPDLTFHWGAMSGRIPHTSSGRPPLATLLVWQLANTTGFVRESLNGYFGTHVKARSESQ